MTMRVDIAAASITEALDKQVLETELLLMETTNGMLRL
jgi:hypothetical protein